MKNFKQYINENNIDINKIKEECKRINPDINYSSSNWKKEFIEKVNWDNISRYQNLSEDFIKYFKEYVNWYLISLHQILSEDFMEYFKNYLNWDHISWSQKLSEEFIKKYKDKINFKELFNNRNISNEFILNHIQWFINVNINYSWRLEDKEFLNKFNKYKKLFGN